MIIPFHKNLSTKELNEQIRFHRLKSLNDYDTSLPHRHGYFEIFFFEEGSGSHLIDYKRVEIEKNSIHVVCPGQVHQLQLLTMAKGCFLTFSETFLLDHLASLQIQQFSFLQAFNTPTVLQESTADFQSYLAYTHQIELTETPSIACAWLNLILHKLKLAFESRSDFHKRTSSNTVLLKFKSVLERHFTEQHLPRFYAHELAITEKQLNLKIKEAYEITVTEAIVERIVLEAKRLLMNSKLPIKTICYDLGFSDPAYFSRFIKKHTGITPKELRNAK